MIIACKGSTKWTVPIDSPWLLIISRKGWVVCVWVDLKLYTLKEHDLQTCQSLTLFKLELTHPESQTLQYKIWGVFFFGVFGPWLFPLLSGLPGTPCCSTRGAYRDGEWSPLRRSLVLGLRFTCGFFSPVDQKVVHKPFQKQSLIHKPPVSERAQIAGKFESLEALRNGLI